MTPRVGALAVSARQPASGERAPRDHAHAVAQAGGQNLRLDAADEDRVRRLFADEPCVAPLLGHPLRLDNRRRRVGRRAEVPDLARTLEVGQRTERLVVVRVGIPAMDLVEVDPVRLQAAQAGLDLSHDPPARVSLHVRVGVVHRAVHLCREHDRIAPAAQCLADDLFRLAARVHVRGVDEVDPGVQGAVDDADRLVVIRVAPRAEHHRAEAQRGDMDAGAAELAGLHEAPFLPWPRARTRRQPHRKTPRKSVHRLRRPVLDSSEESRHARAREIARGPQSRMKRNNLAGRIGAWAAANPKDALFGWISFVAIAVALGAHFGTKPMPSRESTTGESARADRLLSRVGLSPPVEEAVLVQITRLHTPTVELYKAVRDAVHKLQSIDDVRKLRSPLDPGNPDLMAWDLRSALITFRVRGKPDQAAKRMEPILTTVKKVQNRHPKVYVAEFGKASSDHALEKSIGNDFKRAEISTVPMTIAILLVAFGAMVAAGLPVALSFSGVLATLGLAGLASHLFPMANDAKSVILLVGMAVGIDYSLFYIRREREERAKGYSRREALLR